MTMSTGNIQRYIERQPPTKRKCISDDCDDLPVAKKRRLLDNVYESFLRKCKAWRDRQRKTKLGWMLYIEAKIQDVQRKVIAEVKVEIVPKASKITRLLDNNDAKQDVKYTAKVAVTRSGQWRTKGEKSI